MLSNYFNYLVNLGGRMMSLYAPPATPGAPVPAVNAKILRSNYFAKKDDVGGISANQREFIVRDADAQKALGRAPLRGDRIKDPSTNTHVIVAEVILLPDLGGNPMGYRMRTE